MVVGFVSCVLAGALRAALSPSGPGLCKLVSNVLWRAVLGQQKGRLIRAAHRRSVCPVVGHLNATKGWHNSHYRASTHRNGLTEVVFSVPFIENLEPLAFVVLILDKMSIAAALILTMALGLSEDAIGRLRDPSSAVCRPPTERRLPHEVVADYLVRAISPCLGLNPTKAAR